MVEYCHLNRKIYLEFNNKMEKIKWPCGNNAEFDTKVAGSNPGGADLIKNLLLQ